MWIALAALGLVILITLGVSLWIFYIAFYNKNDRDVSRDVLTGKDYDRFHDEMLGLIDSAMKIPFEEVYITSGDGLRLFGRIYFQREGAPFHIQFNGYRGNGIRDFSGGLQLALGAGDNVLLVDQRSHGKSEGHVISFGVKERADVVSWSEYIVRRYGQDTVIFVEGVSMGAATVLMASDLELPKNVAGIVADCPYSSPYKIICEVARHMFKLSWLARPFVFTAALLFGHFNVFASSAEKSVKNTKVPIILIHGTGDNFVPFQMSRDIYAANPDMITFVPVEGAPHGLSCLQDREKYTKAVFDFWNKNISR